MGRDIAQVCCGGDGGIKEEKVEKMVIWPCLYTTETCLFSETETLTPSGYVSDIKYLQRFRQVFGHSY